MINTKNNRDNLFVYLQKRNLISKLGTALASNGPYHLRESDGKICARSRSMSAYTPWVHVKHEMNQYCDIWHHVIFDRLGFVPTACRDCYKVVVQPKTLLQLFDLYELMKELDLPSKCGVEMRRTDTRCYGGYFYCRGINQGKERFSLVRSAIDADPNLGPDVPVILKRYCTEYEVGPEGKGPSDQLPPLTEDESFIEQYLIDNIEHRTASPIGQPEHLVASVMVLWIWQAYQIGDETYKAFTAGSPLVAPVVTYH